MQNGLGESFWDANGAEIGACTNFTDFPGIRENLPDPKKMPDPRKISRFRDFPGTGKFSRIPIFGGNLRMPQSRRHERPRSSRSQHSNPGGASCRSSASVAQIIAAASIKVMDALFGLVARNDAECCKRELLGLSLIHI